jgi:hypothetical protein
VNPRRPFLATLGLVACVGCSFVEGPSRPAAAVSVEPTVPRLLPVDYVIEHDQRPLDWRQDAYIQDVLSMEITALVLECELEAAQPDAPNTRRERAKQDRAVFATQLQAATTMPSGGPESALTLRPIDRFLYDFATERMRAEGYDFAALEAWRAGNRQFIATKDLAVRDGVLALRAPALASLAKAMPLRQLLADLKNGPLDPDVRARTLGALKIQYPGAPLPAGGFAAAAAPRESKPEAALVTPQGVAKVATPKAAAPTGLPALDGAEPATKELPDLRALLTGAAAGAPQKD